jgi:hypothetical protein
VQIRMNIIKPVGPRRQTMGIVDKRMDALQLGENPTAVHQFTFKYSRAKATAAGQTNLFASRVVPKRVVSKRVAPKRVFSKAHSPA